MPTNILMPALSPTMEKGNLAKWLKKEGDTIKSGDVIAEIETDKATMEYEAVDDGTLAKIVVPEGTQDVAVNSVIAVLAGEGEDVKAAAAGAKSAPAPKPAEAPKPQAAPPKTAAPSPQAMSPAKPAAPPPPQPAVASGGNRVFSSPLARRLAKEAGVDLSRVSGSGPHGRVIARDIEDAKSGKGLRAPGAPSSAATTGASVAPTMSDQQIRALYEDGSYDFVPHDGMRRTIAQRLTASAQTIPHFYETMDCDIGKLVAAREEINAAAPKDKGGKPVYKLSVNDFVIKALALALQRVPDANVSWTDGGMLKHKHSDVSVAVALPGGLITPIVRQAETKSLSAISNEMRDLAARARAGKLKPHEYQGGTTSVSNLGMYGIKDFTAVINPPQSTILAVGTGEERAVVRDGQLAVATIMSVTLSCDHRAVDGALGAVLIGAFKALIENPVMMLV
jgi:pyruvate dehydrogenase E2 component (dihydrolipoamide acetyltransferase)